MMPSTGPNKNMKSNMEGEGMESMLVGAAAKPARAEWRVMLSAETNGTGRFICMRAGYGL